ncbi:MAG: DUF3352 domain-containing protein [Propionicimonas sp.]|uniref:DUF3352 domain-containing protein n=1 Tax=Propionicimonas sp. TaxID=1955623 RepID=UPI003D0B4D6A
MTCPSCGQDLADPTQSCPTCGHPAQESPWSRPDSEVQWAAPESAPEAPGVPLSFASPAEYAAAHPDAAASVATFVPEWTTAVPARRRRRALPVLVAALVLVLVGGGVAAAGTYLGWFGGAGSRPAQVVPASAVGYVQVDLDPSLAQKAAVWQFLRDLPEVRDAVAAGDADPRAIAWKVIAQAEGSPLAGLDYATDVKPWLGDALAFAAVPHGTGAAGLVVVQVSDESKARTALTDIAAKVGQPCDVTFRDGYALLTLTDDTRAVLAALDAGTLAQSQAFAADFASLGDPGILAGWADLGALAKLQGADDSSEDLAKGRAVGALSFSADTLALAGRIVGLGDVGLHGQADIGELPASTWAAVGYAGLGEALQKAWPQVETEAGPALEGMGLTKEDLIALLGSSVTVGVSSPGSEPDLASTPDLGARIVTPDPDRASAALEKLRPGLSGEAIFVRTGDGVLTVSSSQSYGEELVRPTDRLVAQEVFTKAVPDHATATVSGFVNLAVLKDQLDGVDARYRDFVGSLRSVGLSYVSDGDDSGAWAVRLIRS